MKPSGPPAALEEYIASLVDYCTDLTFQGEYRIRTYYHKHLAEGDQPGDESDTCASITIDTVYLQIALNIYPPLIARWKDKKFETVGGIILHELCHGFLKPLQHEWQWDDSPSIKKHRQEVVERQTTRIQISIEGLLPEGWFLPTVVIPKMNKVKAGRIRK